MEQILIISQTVFYVVFSAAIVALGILFAIVTYHLICITKHVDRISKNIDNASEEITANVREIIEQLSAIPLLSFLFKKKIGKSKR